MKKWFILMVLCGLTLSYAHADTKILELKLKKQYPELSIQTVNPTPIPGIYEIYLGEKILYTDQNARYFFTGSLLDLVEKKNLSQEHLAQYGQININTLPLNQAIRYSKGNGQRKLYVFSDPDCPYCRKLEQLMTTIDHVTVYLFLMPLTKLHPNAEIISDQIWCASKPYDAWEDYMLHHIEPKSKVKCSTPIQKNLALAKSLKITGTPTLFLENGYRLSGVPESAQQLDMILDSVHQDLSPIEPSTK